jgi:anthranilate/para-aminobenzoate synthase component II
MGADALNKAKFFLSLQKSIEAKDYHEVSFAVLDAVFHISSEEERQNVICKIARDRDLQYHVNFRYFLVCFALRNAQVGLAA